MKQGPRSGTVTGTPAFNGPTGTPALHRWNAVLWVLCGLLPPAIATADDPTANRAGVLALLAVLSLSYALTALFPGQSLLRPRDHLCVLALGLGGVSYLMGGGAALYVFSQPHFWIYSARPATAIAFSGAAAVLVVAGDLLRAGPDGWVSELTTGNVVAVPLGFAGGVLLGLAYRVLTAESEARAHRLADELHQARQRLAEIEAEALREQGATEERERLSREIHDTLAQGFASIVVLAGAARTALESDPERTAQQLRSIEQTARENFAEARVLVGSAPSSGLTPGPVSLTLRRVLDRFAEDTDIRVNAELGEVSCDQPTRIALLRCLQESLANVRKHAGASTVAVVLARRSYGVELEVTDDGSGFVVEESRGFGLDGMRKRLAELGGELTVTSSIGDGTLVLAVIPDNGQV
ncbi:sensor histidine kinase [Streptomyces sp. NPDC051018]|uniref:sensor histidine kinase n=1 Tax=Streptomyces sp. NPDC051018 TaxID=3365639 RepID=UPI003791A504